MRNIAGSYVRKGKLIHFNVDIPGDWNELDPSTFSHIIQVLHFRKADPYTISVSLLALIFGSRNFHILDGLPDEDLHTLIPTTNFLLEEKPPLKNFFPEINLKKKKHIAPAEDLSNLGFGEWCFVFEFYNYYHLTNDVQWLNKLIAALYRPLDPEQNEDSVNYSGDKREKFNENLIEKRAKSVEALEERIKLAILSWFSVALTMVAENRPHVFPKKQEGETSTELNTEQTEMRTWLTVFRELLGSKWGTSDQLKETNAMFILDELEDRQIEYEKLSKKR